MTQSYTKEERDAIVEALNLERHKTKKHLWVVDDKLRWSNMNEYQMGVWSVDLNGNHNDFTNKQRAAGRNKLQEMIDKGVMPLAVPKNA